MTTELQAKSQAENWARYVIKGAEVNIAKLLPPGTLPYAEYKAVYEALADAVKSLEAAHDELCVIQLARKVVP